MFHMKLYPKNLWQSRSDHWIKKWLKCTVDISFWGATSKLMVIWMYHYFEVHPVWYLFGTICHKEWEHIMFLFVKGPLFMLNCRLLVSYHSAIPKPASLLHKCLQGNMAMSPAKPLPKRGKQIQRNQDYMPIAGISPGLETYLEFFSCNI